MFPSRTQRELFESNQLGEGSGCKPYPHDTLPVQLKMPAASGSAEKEWK